MFKRFFKKRGSMRIVPVTGPEEILRFQRQVEAELAFSYSQTALLAADAGLFDKCQDYMELAEEHSKRGENLEARLQEFAQS